ncbi:DUF1905 domain-containing protein [Winogradskyella haliclonae]|nr:DUF1905 domain-containing protein [Winogradskyella haliclonae]
MKYTFSSKLWKSNGNGGWYFMSLPELMSKEIRTHLQWQEEGWGRLKANAKIKNLQWETAIWFDTKTKTYLLPIKAVIRKKLNLEIDNLLEVEIFI